MGTHQNYKQLSSLYKQTRHQPFEILLFPCNSFGRQEPGDAEEIRTFLNKYDVQFPVFAKTMVNGGGAHPVFKYLKLNAPEGSYDIDWNFEKFLVNSNGQVIARFNSDTTPQQIYDRFVKRLLE